MGGGISFFRPLWDATEGWRGCGCRAPWLPPTAEEEEEEPGDAALASSSSCPDQERAIYPKTIAGNQKSWRGATTTRGTRDKLVALKKGWCLRGLLTRNSASRNLAVWFWQSRSCCQE